MTHLLHIDSSPRGERSHSRRMTREFVEAWQQTHPSDTVTYRDIGRQPVPHVDEPWIVAAYTPPEQRTPEMWEALSVSVRLIDELIAADIVVVGCPMYNFSIPSTFKAYIDQIVRTGHTFAIDPEDAEDPYKPLLHGKKMFVITARGASGFGPGERYGHMNHQDPYLRVAFGFIGITDITFVHIENDEHSSESLAASIAAAQAQVAELVAA
ncbi:MULTISPECIES: FMN-dependent NADH-azoreductase [Cyanophyceae]|uniref:FMN-dependent NADH-azoreductase n=1 Tax=Cyanophyceae TaxID=3028117 RepID=UPI0016851415|nr:MULTISPECIES: FMN-dependent NADH-azoreductase [Cyanophyceae]MBD1915971.1 FMN-dependent NADH-azoreductase [Phormidium sp. FACHB-77]MBD2030355.1 FMN-dependent NADH-azoreductase [Phormidium sp. FACHB-322]MBD2053357.1 FMN-dependent NADH-azoreductase [Leptolyngbya sp. FACHB-60]